MAGYLYIHIPFCLKKCIYCDFYSVSDSKFIIGAYMTALCKELEMRKEYTGKLGGIYIGGGTPSILKGKDIATIMDKIRSTCHISAAAEITSEANPGTLTESGIKGMLNAGINRISIGVQSLRDKELSLLGRMHDAAEAIAAVTTARKSGFGNISLDLIYGIPGQDLVSWKRTLEKIVSLHSEHISAYELTPEKNTVLYEQLEKGRLHLPDEDEVAEMYYTAIDILTEAGYKHYEISNFALPNLQCRHNLNYWDRGEYLGIGAGAHSFLNGRRISNICDVRQYIHDVELGALPIAEETLLTRREEIEETLFLGLRKTDGFDIELIPADITEHLKEALDDLSHQGLLDLSGGHIKLTRKGLIICNSVIVRLMLRIERILRA
jgi:oxygen-independent coproporphyrinogen-3 oxidase